MKRVQKLRALVSSVLAISVAAVSLPMAFAAEGTENGLWAEYYSGRDCNNFVASAREETVDHAWTDSNLPLGLSSVEEFSVRWNGNIVADEAGDYTIYTNVDDGLQVYIDGELVINDGGPHTPEESSANFTWEAGSVHSIEMEYYNGELGGTMQLMWSTPSSGKTIIPAENLTLPDQAAVDWIIDEDTIAAAGHIYWEDTASYVIVLESYNEDGTLVESVEARRPGGEPTIWESDTVTYAEGLTYRAYMTDRGGNVVSPVAEKIYGVDAYLDVDASNVVGEVSPYLYGACMEDVNHELYGGIWSQMVYGESFAEPSASAAAGFAPAGGEWKTEVEDGETIITVARQDNGPKLVLEGTECESGMFSADVWFEGEGPVGFIVKTSQAAAGADNFYGYEVGLMNGQVKVARHENNYDASSERFYASSDIRPGTWVNLKVETTRDNIAVYVNDVKLGDYPTVAAVTSGSMALRAWSGSGKYKNFQFQAAGGELQNIAIPTFDKFVSGMWESVERGTAEGAWALDKTDPYTKNLTSTGAQSQEINFVSGEGAIGVNNMGLNRKGMNFEADKEYEGYVYIRSEEAAEVYVVLESADGSAQYGEAKLDVAAGNQWAKYSFTITPDAKDAAGRMSIELRQPGSVDLAYAFLQPGEWGRYKGLQVRKDVAEKLEEQNVSILRFGGCMANAGDYKWKNMLGAPEDRPTYTGWWYGYSSFGFGIIEFLDLCEALGVIGVPDFNSYETAEDMADFIDFATGTDENNEWVQLRIEMGHPEPYNLPYLEFGNEEKVDESYAARFNAVAPSIWEKNEDVILIVGDFGYGDVITDPNNITNTASGITNLNAHKSMLELAKEYNRTVYFDVHIWTDTPHSTPDFVEVLGSLYDALHQVCPGTDAKLVIFEYNANIHQFNRALGNAFATIEAEKNSDIFAIVCSANCLQVDGHNDNGWDQGLVFMNNDSAWLQPPAYMTQMGHDSYQPNLLEGVLDQAIVDMNYSVSISDDGNSMSLKFMNYNPETIGLSTTLRNFTGNTNTVTVTSLTADSLTDTNTAENPENVAPVTTTAENAVQDNQLLITLEPYSYTVVQIEKGSEPGDPVVPPAQTLAEAKAAADEAVAGITPDNSVTAEDYMGAVEAVLTNDAIQAAWSEDFAKTEATPEAAGRLQGVITLTLDGETAEVVIDAVIPQLEPEIIPGDVDKDGSVTIQDVMGACKILARNNSGQEPTEDEILRADMTEDGYVRIDDVMAICKILAQQNA